MCFGMLPISGGLYRALRGLRRAHHADAGGGHVGRGPTVGGAVRARAGPAGREPAQLRSERAHLRRSSKSATKRL